MNMMSVDNQVIKKHAQNNLSKLPIAGVQASPASASKACAPAENLQRELFKLFHVYS